MSSSLSCCNSCQSVSNLKHCTCGQAVYCCKACQQEDWVRHKLSCPMVMVKKVEGKGMGMVAVRNIPAGTAIFAEEPLLVYKKDGQDEFFARCFNVPAYDQWKSLDPEKKRELMRLYDPKENNNKFDGHDDPEYVKFCRIVAANDISINNKADPKDVDLGLDCVYKQFSRINHSCYPNSFAECEAGSVTHSVKAGRTIKKGEELTINYQGSKDGTKEDRKEDLLKTWFFDCTCEVCSLTGRESEENDRIRMLVLQHLMEAGSKECLLSMMTDKKNLSSTLSRYLSVLAQSYTIEHDRGKKAMMLSCCHVLYQQVKRIGGGWVWPTDDVSVKVRRVLQRAMGENFLEELDTLAVSAASVMTRYFKAKVVRTLRLMSEVYQKNL